MTITRCAITLSLCVTAPVAFLAVATPAAAKVRSVQVGPIWNQMDAERKCTHAAHREGGRWTGQWRTTRPGQMSECDIEVHHSGFHPGGGSHVSGTYNGGSSHGGWHGTRPIGVGPIWNQIDAQRKCPDAARKEGGTWTGDWRTTGPGQSECDIRK